MLRRRLLGGQQAIELPTVLFRLNFEDANLNDLTRVTDTVSGNSLIRDNTTGIQYINDPQFGRCMNILSQSLDNQMLGASSLFPNLYNARDRNISRTFIAWANHTLEANSGFFNFNNTSLMGISSLNSPNVLATWSGFYVNRLGGANLNEISMFCFKIQNASFYTPNVGTTLTGWISQAMGTALANSPYFVLNGRDPNTNMFTGGIIAGITVYEGAVTDEQLLYILNNKII